MAGRLETGVKVSPLREFMIAQLQSFTEIQKKLVSEVIILVNPLMHYVPKRSDTL